LPVLLRYVRAKNISDLVVVSPDVGGVKMASAYAQVLRAGLAIVVKRRISATETEAQHVIGEVEGKNVLLVDDLTETAGTLAGAAKMLRAAGAMDIYAMVSHAVLTPMAAPPEFRNQGIGGHGQCSGSAPGGMPDHNLLRGGTAGRGDQAHPRRRIRDFFV